MADWKREAEARERRPESGPWKCPLCRTLNEGSAAYCDCGYNRITGNKVSPTTETERILIRDGIKTRDDLRRGYARRLVVGSVLLLVGFLFVFGIAASSRPVDVDGYAVTGMILISGSGMAATGFRGWMRHR